MGIIKQMVNDQAFKTWFEPIVPMAFRVNTLTIQVPSQFFYEWLEDNYVHVLKAAIEGVIGAGAKLEYSIIVDKGNSQNQPYTVNLPNSKNGYSQNSNDHHVTQSKFLEIFQNESNLNPNLTFENFIEGDCNRLGRSAGMAVAQKPGITSFNPLVIFGGVGLGKTHLVQAIGNKIKSQFTNKSIFYIDSLKFVQMFTDYISNNELKDFNDFFMQIDVLIIDDIQFFANKGKSQEMFFQIFNHMHQSSKQIIMTSDRSPKDLEGLQDRLLSRFKWGLSADVQQPDLETKIAIIKSKMHREGITIPENVVEYIAYSVDTSVRDLEGVLISLIAQSYLTQKEIDLELTKETLKSLVHDIDSDVSIDFIQKCIAEYFNVTVEELKDKTRKKEIVTARHIAMYFAKEYTSLALKTIGYHFGKRDHTTVLHALEAVNDLMETDKKYLNAIKEIQKRLKMKAI